MIKIKEIDPCLRDTARKYADDILNRVEGDIEIDIRNCLSMSGGFIDDLFGRILHSIKDSNIKLYVVIDTTNVYQLYIRNNIKNQLKRFNKDVHFITK